MPGHYGSHEHNLVSVSSPVATQLLHAVGIALAAKIRKTGQVAMTSMGEGSSNQGDVHEGLNFAAIHKLPFVFVVENNGYAISVPLAKQVAGANVADRAAGYGMPGVRVDGNDPLAVKSALDDALRRARGGPGGNGPTFLECVTFRFRGHSFGDRMPYFPKEQLEAALAADPVPRFRRQLAETGVCSPDELDRLDGEAAAAVEAALHAVMSADSPSIDELDRDVYATPIKFPV
jgi:pyruvate dehydrogenase E1 component alpha subunit